MKREHIFAHYEEDASRYWKLQEGGYATPMSVRQGERVIFHISNSRSYYDIFVFREGANRRLVKEINDLRGALHAVPDFGYRDGFDWTPKASPTPQTPGSTRPWGSTTTATTARWPSTKRSSKGRYSPPRPIEWAHGLYRDDSPVAQITRNVLNRLGYPKTRSRLPPPLPAHPG